MSEVHTATVVKVRMMDGCDDLFPVKAHDDDAGYDLMSRIEMEISKGQTVLVPTGVFTEFNKFHEIQIRPRSGLALKQSIIVVNSPGTIDAGYRGEIGVILHKLSEGTFKIVRGQKIAQMVVHSLPNVMMAKANELSDSARGEGGFGSSDKKGQ